MVKPAKKGFYVDGTLCSKSKL